MAGKTKKATAAGRASKATAAGQYVATKATKATTVDGGNAAPPRPAVARKVTPHGSAVRATVSVTRPYAVVLTPDPTGGYTAEVPALPGCRSEGDTLAEAKRNVRQAIAGFLVAQEKAKRIARARRAGVAEA